MGSSASLVKEFKVNNGGYNTYEQFISAVRDAKIECARFVVAVDFSRSNISRGQKDPKRGANLHSSKDIYGNTVPNDYRYALERLIEVIRLLDSETEIKFLTFGMKKKLTTEQIPVEDLVQHYDVMVTEFLSRIEANAEAESSTIAPLIYETIKDAVKNRDYQILVILTDGDLTDIGRDAQAIIDASNFSISIIAIGIGIGPFTCYSEFDNVLFQRRFDNFNFINLSELLRARERANEPPMSAKDFARIILSECPAQYRDIRELNIAQ
ncbi:Phospholipid-binding Copine Family Protein [Giardia duodenalis]|uniref:Coiled-coil protein n=2 Tax=Giardia intestinalis TaxID=5741 RepID=C6LY96_GIAIB|nr:Coiled-coil protein [Giardia intestinalis ATCC 50581]ESU43682.1 Phospholipid-binding Copine Family Protein [Giardia intestinalis]